MAEGWPIRTSYAELKPASWFLSHPLNFRVSTGQLDTWLAGSLDELGWIKPVIVNRRTSPEWGAEQGVDTVLDGHKRIRCALRKGEDTPVPLDWVDLTPALEPIALSLLDEMSTYGTKDQAVLAMLMQEVKPSNMALREMCARMCEEHGIAQGTGLATVEEVEPQIDRAQELQEQWGTAVGQLWEIPSLTVLGQSHRLLCGDSTKPDAVRRFMHGAKAVLCHADPPYGMGKANDGVTNDNLYAHKLDAFQVAWWTTARPGLADNASVYIWGNAEDLWRLWYVGGLRQSERLTLRNEIVWDKGSAETNPTMLVAGVPLESRRMYQPNERCLFFMLGEQGFSINADNYWDGWEPIRTYLKAERDRLGWSNEHCKLLAGHSPSSGCHWFDASQWMMPTEEVYRAWQRAAQDDGFKRDYDDLKRDYDATRAYFDNTHENMTDVWTFPRVLGDERHDHPTPKPAAMVTRILKSSSPEGSLVYDPFAGSGTTLVSAEQTRRLCYGCEIEPRWVAVTLQRLQDMGLEPRLIAS